MYGILYTIEKIHSKIQKSIHTYEILFKIEKIHSKV